MLVIWKLEKKKLFHSKEGLTDQAAELIQRDMVSYYKIPEIMKLKAIFLDLLSLKEM